MHIPIFISWEYEDIAGSKDEAMQKLESKEMGIKSFSDFLEEDQHLSLSDCFFLGGKSREQILNEWNEYKEEVFNEVWKPYVVDVDSEEVRSMLMNEISPNR